MKNWFIKHREVLAYLVFGVLTTLLNIVLYALFSRLFGYEAANSWGNVLDNVICILFAYVTNRAFVFASRTQGREALKEFGAFVTCRLGTLVLDAAIMLVLGNLLAAIVIFLVSLIIIKLLMKAIRRALERSKLERAIRSFILSCARVLLCNFSSWLYKRRS